MRIEALAKYKPFYNSSNYMGSAKILCRYLGIDQSIPVPLSISHGVDFNQTLEAMDVRDLPPIHWAYNEHIYQRAIGVKPCIKLPHPWLLLRAGVPERRGSGSLVIGAPPGQHNDENLFKCLQDAKIVKYDLLVKHRGTTNPSVAFWESRGVQVVTAGEPDDRFYERLFELINRYEHIIGCTLSSALFFASSCGKKCSVINNYTYSFYDSIDHRKDYNFSSQLARDFLNCLVEQRYSDARELSDTILGSALMKSPTELRLDFMTALKSLDEPVHFNNNLNQITRKLVLSISALSGKAGLIRHGLLGYLRNRAEGVVPLWYVKINEIDVWFNGFTETNFFNRKVKYVKNVRQAGWGGLESDEEYGS